MKYVLVFLVVFLVAWRWRSARSHGMVQKQQAKARAAAQPTQMVACAQCGLHLPQHDALPGRRGNYCSAAHRQSAEG
ncbi:PP0621 family protein [uncultured Rhodoferax sp.]|uniref:PP0621 family protein n=1 Tax=uncultured Rhodoferax sp. TaxID=223188 RepID=UPI00260080C2|nr:PP0621 family protein [uncultured Rhodoferax sp.]